MKKLDEMLKVRTDNIEKGFKDEATAQKSRRVAYLQSLIKKK